MTIAELISIFRQPLKPIRDMPRILIIALLAAALSPLSMGQMRGRPGITIGNSGVRHFRSGGFGYPFFYSDYGPESVAPAPAPPLVVEKVLQPERPLEPLLIEWQGDRFVRYGETQKAESPDYAEVASARVPGSASGHDLPPAVLVYRDGHREEVSDYVITRGVLYARGNGYSQASRNIQLSALDLSATFQANQNSGVRFVLPERSNDVVTRP
jgi:hypothetical protein